MNNLQIYHVIFIWPLWVCTIQNEPYLISYKESLLFFTKFYFLSPPKWLYVDLIGRESLIMEFLSNGGEIWKDVSWLRKEVSFSKGYTDCSTSTVMIIYISHFCIILNVLLFYLRSFYLFFEQCHYFLWQNIRKL